MNLRSRVFVLSESLRNRLVINVECTKNILLEEGNAHSLAKLVSILNFSLSGDIANK
jgi:hypothetical protein